LRAAVFAILPVPGLIVAAQVLDGISAAVFGVMVPLIAADLTRGRGRFNLCVGIFGLATGIGATISTSLAGWIADATGERIAFAALAGIGMAGLALLGAAMPETAPDKPAAAPPPTDIPKTTLVVPSARPAQRMEARRPGLRAERRRGYAHPVRGGVEWRSRT
jgi:MFS family permease